MCTLEKLTSLMEQCQADTARHCGQRAANRLDNWRRHNGSKEQLVAFIKRCVTSGDGWENGRTLEGADLLSLESIVVDHCSSCFSDAVKIAAQQTLGRK